MDEDFGIPAGEEMMDEDPVDQMPEEEIGGKVMKVGEDKEIGEQGLKKKLVKEGEGWDHPETGDEVEDAFGESGKQAASGDEAAVPPNSTLHIDLELVSWKTVTEIGYDKTIIKKILKEGESHERPNDGAVVEVKLIGKLDDGTIFVKKGHEGDEPFEFKTDEEQVIEGLDAAVMSMKKGEVAFVTIPLPHPPPPACFPLVPPNSTVYYEIELVSFVKEKESRDLNTAEKIEAAATKKEEGNALFKLGKYARASKRYEKAAKFIDYDSSFSDEEKEQSQALKLTYNLNNAACKPKLRDYKQAVKLCTKNRISKKPLKLILITGSTSISSFSITCDCLWHSGM